MKTLSITSIDNARVKAVLALRQKSRDRRDSGLLIAEGLREMQRALDAGLVLREWWWCPAMLEDQRDAWQALQRQAQQRWSNASLLEANARVMQKLGYGDKPAGALGVFVAPRWELEKLLDTAAAKQALWLVAVGTEKPGNLGAMVRSASAAGAAGVFVADEVADPFNPNAIRASTAAVFSLPVLEVPGQVLRAALHQRGIRLAAAVAEGGTDCSAADLTGPLAIVIGPEDRGLDEAWLSGSPAPLRLTIPMATGPVDSLNASVAAAVLLFESARQRRDKSGR